jgi:hypothetical protein
MNFFTNFLFIVMMVAMFDGGWGPKIAITWRLSSVCKLFQKSSPLKPLGQFKPNLA